MPVGIKGTGHWDYPTGAEARGRRWIEKTQMENDAEGRAHERRVVRRGKSKIGRAIRKIQAKRNAPKHRLGQIKKKWKTDKEWFKHELSSPYSKHNLRENKHIIDKGRRTPERDEAYRKKKEAAARRWRASRGR